MNPYAGKRRANKYLADILEMFNRADYLVTVHMTAGPGDATGVVILNFQTLSRPMATE